jgi:hypothetical protein
MIWSESAKIIGVGIPKTATQSLAASLDVDSVSSSRRHSTALQVADDLSKLGKVWGDYYTFVITRNPWDRYYSFYNFLVANSDTILPQRVDPKMVFKSFIEQMDSQDVFFLDRKGEVMVSHLGDFKNLDDEFALLCGKLDIEMRSLQHVNASNPMVAKEDLFDDEVVDIIAQKESVVIDLMGYNYPG